MNLLNFLFRSRSTKVQAELIREVSLRSQEAVWDRVRARIFQMRPAEARGYVRARATAVIRREMEVLSDLRGQLDEAISAQVRLYATERVVFLVMNDFAARGPAGRRKAA